MKASVRLRSMALLGCLVAVVAGLIVAKDAPNQAPAASSAAQANHAEKSQADAAHADAHSHVAQEQLEQLMLQPSQVALLDAQNLHFSAPAMLAAERFASGSTRVVLDQSCEARSSYKPDANQSIEQTLRSEFGLDANDRVPTSVPFDELTQFYRIGAEYFQLSAIAKPASRPPIYTLSLYRAEDPQMRARPAQLALPVALPEVIDAFGVVELFEQVLGGARAQHAELGARLMNVRIPGADGAAAHELRFLNAAPLQWAFGSGVCQLSADVASAFCRCLPDGEQLQIPEV